MASLLFSFLFLVPILSSAMDMSILNYEHGLHMRTEKEVMAMFESWLVRNGKVYNALGEREKRYEIFKDNLKYIDERNAMNLTYKLGLTTFADLTNEEYRSIYLRRIDESQLSLNGSLDSDRYSFRAGDSLPASVDWRKKGAVLPDVKNQGRCSNCWAFSTVAAVEGINQIVTGKLISLSEQEVNDCSRNKGCQNGYLHLAYAYVDENSGIDTAERYPFRGVTMPCNPNRVQAVSIDGYEKVTPSRDEKSLQKAVANQPISVSIDSSGRDFQLYKGGLFRGQCKTTTDHFVVAVGYGSERGLDYWILRNSWGPNWGDNGYAWLPRNVGYPEGKCGIATWSMYPIKNGQNTPNPEEKVWSA